MKRFIRLFITAILGVLVGGVIGLTYTGYLDPSMLQRGGAEASAATLEEQIIDEATVGLGTLSVTVSATGTVLPIRQSRLNFETSAIVEEVLVQEGQPVQEGDVLATLDTFDLEVAERNAGIALRERQVAYEELIAAPRDVDLQAAQAAVSAAQASLGAAAQGPDEEDIEIARIAVEQARNSLWQTQLRRDLTLNIGETFRDSTQQDAGAQEIQLDTAAFAAERAVEIAELNLQNTLTEGPNAASVGAARAALIEAQVALDRLVDGPDEVERRIAEVQLEQAQIALEQAEVELEKAQVIAPYDGIIAEENLTVGELPPEGTGIEIIDTSAYYVDVTIDETDVADISVGQTVELVLDALPEATITGTITQLDVTPTEIGQVKTYVAQVTLDPTLEPIRTGMSATATVVVSQIENALILPNRFVRIDRNTAQAFVTIINGEGKLEEIPVQLGERNDFESEIVDGIEVGERVVLLPRDTFNIFAGGPPGG